MKAVVLSSGGVDSTTCLALAIDEYGKENVSSLAIKYGQKHIKELECSKNIADYYGINHYELDLTEVFRYNTTCSLLNQTGLEVEKKSYEEQLEETNGNIIATSVPFRNALFTSAVVSLAMSLYPDEKVEVFLGIHQDDNASAYPDCSPEFNKAMADAVHFGTAGLVELTSPFVNKKKEDIVKKGLELNVPYELTFSCYSPTEDGKACGECGTCRDRIKAFRLNGVEDPIEYAR